MLMGRVENFTLLKLRRHIQSRRMLYKRIKGRVSVMDIVKKTIKGNEYMFVNSFRGNRSGFVHETELFKNDRLIGRNKIQYYNRTWECYTYQSVMKGCVSRPMEELFEEFKTTWKNDHNVKRLTEAKRKAMMEDFENNPPINYAELKELYDML